MATLGLGTRTERTVEGNTTAMAEQGPAYDKAEQLQQIQSGLLEGEQVIGVGAHSYEVEFRGAKKSHHVHNVILHYVTAAG
jgi:hypothetical protein